MNRGMDENDIESSALYYHSKKLQRTKSGYDVKLNWVSPQVSRGILLNGCANPMDNSDIKLIPRASVVFFLLLLITT